MKITAVKPSHVQVTRFANSARCERICEDIRREPDLKIFKQ